MKVLIDSTKIPGLEEIPDLVHGFSPRNYKIPGESKGDLLLGRDGQPGSSSNHLGWFLRSLNIETDEVYLLKQIHSDRIYALEDPSATSAQVASVEADVIVTHLGGKPIAVLTADCIPIIVCDSRLHVVGVVHAGRRGTAENILFKTVAFFKDRYGSQPENIIVGMGPGIGGCCYEVDEPCIRPFKKNGPRWKRFVKQIAENKYRLDLFQANVEDSLTAGVPPGNIFRSGQCTACETHRFFSYRKEGETGRMMALAMLGGPA